MDRRTLPTWVVEWCAGPLTMNYGRGGGFIDALGVVVDESYLELEVAWMVQWAEWHANWGA